MRKGADLSDLYAELEDRNIHYAPHRIGFAEAVTLELDGAYAIFVDTETDKSAPALKAILAHELGHCATGTTHSVKSPFDTVGRHEHRANRWSYEKLLPWEQLCAAIHAGRTEYWQLAEHFDLPEAYIRAAVRYYTEAQGLCVGRAHPPKGASLPIESSAAGAEPSTAEVTAPPEKSGAPAINEAAPLPKSGAPDGQAHPYRDLLKRAHVHILFSSPTMGLDDLTEQEALALLELIAPEELPE